MSVLYPLKPLGLDTPFVESLTSYVRRLSASHVQRPTRLINELIAAPHLERTGHELTVPQLLTEGVNGLVDATEVIVAYLASLTSVAEVRRTALGHRVPGIYLARSMAISRRWCPACLADDPEPYDRLLWSFKSYAACVTHERALTSQCHKCGREHLPFRKKATAYACPCGALLSQTRTAKLAPTARERALVDLVLRLEHGKSVTREQVLGGVQAFVRASGDMNKSAALIGRTHATFGNLFRRDTPMHLDLLLETLAAADEPLADFLAHPYERRPRRTMQQVAGRRRNGSRRQALLRLEGALRAELTRPDETLRSVGEFARDHGTSQKSLSRVLPELVHELAVRGQAMRKRRRQAREAALLQQVCDTIRAYHAEHGVVNLYRLIKAGTLDPVALQGQWLYRPARELCDELNGQAKRRKTTAKRLTKENGEEAA